MRVVTSLISIALLALAAFSQEVTLPLDRYESLRERAYPTPAPTPAGVRRTAACPRPRRSG